jgi:sugar phosphate isomerase/epimerase
MLLAGKDGIIVAAENTLSVEATLDLFKRIDRPNLKLYFDTQNYYLSKGLDTPTLLETLMDYICQVHVKDGKNKDLSGALLGEGDTGFHRSMEVLKKHHYSGWIVLENYYDQQPLSAKKADPSELIATDIKTLKAALQ